MTKKMMAKAPSPISLLNTKDIPPIISIYFEFVHLKQLFRQGWLTRGIPAERCESVAEHSFGVAVIAMILADSLLPELDLLKVLRMALIHDFGEVYAGDIIPEDQISTRQKYQAEQQSLARIFEPLPNCETYLNLWKEFESGESKEAQFVRQIDKLEMALQASVYEHQELQNLAEFFQSAGFEISMPELNTIFNKLEKIRLNNCPGIAG